MFAAVVGLSLGLQPLSECELTDAPAAIVLNQIGFEHRACAPVQLNSRAIRDHHVAVQDTLHRFIKHKQIWFSGDRTRK